MSISDYLTWHATGCDEVKEEYPAKCHMLFAQIVLATGNIDGDDLYSNYCTGNRYVTHEQLVALFIEFQTHKRSFPARSISLSRPRTA